ncbi:hypothetical protein IJH06_01450 [Candidatus Saccharibacteria bacterium]|nr:hypothetical protein [Candidatus Saccharibacteria bacterium]
MEKNLTLAEEEVVHENSCIHFEIKNPILRAIFYLVCWAGFLSPLILAEILG